MTKLLKIDGKPVVDAKKSAVLYITDDDVKRGNKKAPDCCAAALACQRQWGAEQAHVYLSRVYIELGGKWLRFKTPAALRTEIVSFDRGHKFEAGAYTLGRLPPSNMAGRRKGTRPDLGRPGVKSPQRGRRAKAIKVTGVRVSAGTKLAQAIGVVA